MKYFDRKYLLTLLLLAQIACTPDAPHHPIVGIYTVTHNADTWAWHFEPDGTLIEATGGQIIGGGMWYDEAGQFVTLTARHGELRGELRKVVEGWEYVVDGEMYKLTQQ